MARLTVKKLTLIGGFSLAVAVLVIAGSIFLRKPALDFDPLVGKAIDPPVKIPHFELIDQRRQPFTEKRLSGHWTIAMIGYTYCPDVCPITVSQVAAFYKQLKGLSGKVNNPEFVFISTDPYRDTPEMLSNYVEYHNKEFVGVTGEPSKIAKLVKELGLYYAYTDPKDNHMLDDVLTKPVLEDYGVIHSTRLLFISPNTELVATMSWPYTPENILTFYNKLYGFYGD